MADGVFTRDGIDSRQLYNLYVKGVEAYAKKPTPIDRFTQKTDKESVVVWQRSMDFVRGAEGYEPDMQKLSSLKINIPLHDYALGYGFTLQSIQDSIAEELDETQREALRADQRLLQKLFIKTLTTTGGFWDGTMTTAPPAYGSNTFTAEHTHYNATGSTTLDLDDLTSLKKHIREHGYTGGLVLFINSNEVKAIEDLAGWTTAMTSTTIIDDIAKFGAEKNVTMYGFSVVVNDFVPAGYLVALDANVASVFIREPINPTARGLKLFKGTYPDYPLVGAKYIRRIGMAVGHRGAGAVAQLTAGSYTTPTFSFE